MRILILCFTIFCLTFTTHAEFKSAIAIRVVTPDPLLPLVGGVGASSPSTEARGDLTVRALVLENDGVRVAICSTDFIGFPSPLCKKVRAQVKSIPTANILIGATHTHSAPDTFCFPDGQGGTSVNLDYLDFICTQLAEAIEEAVTKLEPSSMRVATGEVQGKIAYNYYAPMLYDPRASIIQTLDAQGDVITTLVNYANHPEIIGDSNGITSPDFVGPLYDRIEALGGGTPIFMNGAEGGMITADNRDFKRPKTPAADYFHLDRTWAECLRIGHALADESMRIIKNAPVQKNPALRVTMKTVDFPCDNPNFRYIFETSPVDYTLSKDFVASIPINVVNLGNAQMLSLPGEVLPNIGYYLKRKMLGEHNLLLGLTNDHLGYILLKEDWNSFKRYDYITESSMGEMTGEILIEEGLALVNATPIASKGE